MNNIHIAPLILSGLIILLSAIALACGIYFNHPYFRYKHRVRKLTKLGYEWNEEFHVWIHHHGKRIITDKFVRCSSFFDPSSFLPAYQKTWDVESYYSDLKIDDNLLHEILKTKPDKAKLYRIK